MAATPRRKRIVRPVSMELVLKATADSDPVAVFSSSGKLLGIVDPKDITPVSDSGADDDAAKKLPQPTRSGQTEATAGEQPQMGVQKARQQALAVKKSLYGNADAADQARVANEMGEAASRVLKHIHARGPRRRG